MDPQRHKRGIESEPLFLLREYLAEEMFQTITRPSPERLGFVLQPFFKAFKNNLALYNKLTSGIELVWVRARTPIEHPGVLIFCTDNDDLTISILPLHDPDRMQDIDLHHPESVPKLHALINFFTSEQLKEA